MKGRKPAKDNVVPLTGDRAPGSHLASAREKAKRLKPKDLPKELSPIWDRLAMVACDPTLRKRLDDDTVAAFVLLCRAEHRFLMLEEKLREEGETYEVVTRNGLQRKSKPEVAQRNVAWAQYLTLIREFGMTPMSARGLGVERPGQGELPLSDKDWAG